MHKRPCILPHRNKFIVALLKTKTWNQPRCLSVGEWIMKMWLIYTIEVDSPIKKNNMKIVEK